MAQIIDPKDYRLIGPGAKRTSTSARHALGFMRTRRVEEGRADGTIPPTVLLKVEIVFERLREELCHLRRVIPPGGEVDHTSWSLAPAATRKHAPRLPA
jgi:hypothetical protein